METHRCPMCWSLDVTTHPHAELAAVDAARCTSCGHAFTVYAEHVAPWLDMALEVER